MYPFDPPERGQKETLKRNRYKVLQSDVKNAGVNPFLIKYFERVWGELVIKSDH